jgi:hypothetical protein
MAVSGWAGAGQEPRHQKMRSPDSKIGLAEG